jgi:protein tyrosine/serine phosphatase
VPNLAGVRTGLWRGGQPSPEGWRYLHGLGVRKVVKLNTKSEASDREAAALGMEIVYLPMSFVAFREPPPETVQAAVDALKVSNQNVYVHCTHGWDRTGLVVGAYRVWVERRPKETAYKEMLERGFRPRFRGLQHFWETRVGP